MKEPSTRAKSLSVMASRILIVLACALLGLLIASNSEKFFPKQYRSTVTLQIKTGAGFASSTPSSEAPLTLENEFRLIESKDILYPVIDALQLQKRWTRQASAGSKEQAHLSLTSMLSLSEVRNTELVQLSITDLDPKEAAEIANAIATEYKRYTNSRQNNIGASVDLDTLKAETAKKRAKAEALKVSADQLQNEAGSTSEKYLEAKNNYAQALRILTAAEQRLQNEEFNVKGRLPAVLIWEKAEPSQASISVPTPLRLTAGIILGTLIGLLLCLFVRK